MWMRKNPTFGKIGIAIDAVGDSDRSELSTVAIDTNDTTDMHSKGFPTVYFFCVISSIFYAADRLSIYIFQVTRATSDYVIALPLYIEEWFQLV